VNPIPLKQWIHEKAAREGRRPSALYSRLARGKYPALLLCRFNQRVVFVVEVESPARGDARPTSPAPPTFGTGIAKADIKSLQKRKGEKRMKKKEKTKKARPTDAGGREARLRLSAGALMVHHRRGRNARGVVDEQTEFFRAGDAASVVQREGPP
jgi:hypothetical protein